MARTQTGKALAETAASLNRALTPGLKYDGGKPRHIFLLRFYDLAGFGDDA